MNDSMQLSALREQKAALEQQQELLLYAVSHDLRTPVMTVLGFTDMLLADLPDNGNSQQRQYLERIRSATQRQSLLIEDLQRVAQLNTQPLQARPTDLTAIAQHCLHALSKATSAVPTMTIEPTPSVMCDPALMKVALQTLLSNAVKLTGATANALITFGTLSENGQVVFFVRDNGTGFDLGPDQNLLALFRRLQASIEFAGAGIGLLTATVIIHRHGGKLWVDSALNRGTCIYFTLGSH